MGNPKAPSISRSPLERIVGPAHPPVQRLRRCGASPEVILDVRRRWHQLNDAERIEAQAALDNLTDDELRAMVAEQETELSGG